MLIAWPIEVGSRELDARLVFAVEAARKGHVVLSGTKAAVTSMVVEHPQGAVYIHKSASEAQFARFQRLKSVGVMTFAHDEEGPLLTLSWTGKRTAPQTINLLDGFFFFGLSQSRQFDQLGLRPRLSKIVGHPRYDLLSGLLGHYYTNIGQAYREHFGRFVFVAPRAQEFAQQIKFAETLISLGELDACVVKPHPNLREKLEYSPRSWLYFVPGEASFGPLLLGSELLLHSGSTTSLSAAVAGKPSVDFLHPDARLPLLQSRFGTTLGEVDLCTLTTVQTKQRIEFRDDLHVDASTSCATILSFIEAAAKHCEPCPGDVVDRLKGKTNRRAKILSPHGRWKLGSLIPSQIQIALQEMGSIYPGLKVDVTFLSEDLFVVYQA